MAQLRPEVGFDTILAPEEVVRRVGKALRASECPVSGVAASGRLELHVHGPEQHLWSPQLIVEIDESEEGGAHLSGRFGPHPSVWTMYVAGYAVSLFLVLLSVSFAYAQWVMEESPSALLGVPLAALIVVALLMIALFGQRASESQMHQLIAFLRHEMERQESLVPRSTSGGGGTGSDSEVRARSD